MSPKPTPARGPFRADHLPDKSRYELSHGHPVYCAPTGGDGTQPNGLGFTVLGTDPAVERAGVDPGIKLSDDTLRAPDVGVGLGPETPGWATQAPALAVEYASESQDLADLRVKIQQLHAAGTRWVWVVRLAGMRRVEVHEKGQPTKTYTYGQILTAPGVLQNPVPVEALWERDAALDATLRNLLARKGYPSLDAVRAEGHKDGHSEGQAQTLTHLAARRLGRSLREDEARQLVAHLDNLGGEAVLDRCLTLDSVALAAWLTQG
jgi:Uma2 family endonuclease